MLEITTGPLPLRLDEDDEPIPVRDSRVTLDILICAFNQGESPEQIVYSFNTLELADVYTVIGYYLRHRAEVDAYLEQRQREADAFQKQMEALSLDHHFALIPPAHDRHALTAELVLRSLPARLYQDRRTSPPAGVRLTAERVRAANRGRMA